jgi:hypothetical protein
MLFPLVVVVVEDVRAIVRDTYVPFYCICKKKKELSSSDGRGNNGWEQSLFLVDLIFPRESKKAESTERKGRY